MIDYLTNVYGLEHQKQEINNLINWFINDEEYSKKGYKVPRGVDYYYMVHLETENLSSSAKLKRL